MSLIALEKEKGRNRVVIGSAPKSDGAGDVPAAKKVRRELRNVKGKEEAMVDTKTENLFGEALDEVDEALATAGRKLVKLGKTGEQRRDDGAGRALDRSGFWRTAAEAGLARLLRAGIPFTSEDLRAQAGDPPHPNCIGAFMLASAKNGTIEWTGETRASKRERSHAALLKVWRRKGT